MPLLSLFLPKAREMYNSCSLLTVHRSLLTVHRSLLTVHCSLNLFGYSLLKSYLCRNQPLGSTTRELKNPIILRK